MTNLAEVAAGDWTHIHNLPAELYLDDLHPAKLKLSEVSMATPLPHSPAALDGYAILNPSDQTRPGLKH